MALMDQYTQDEKRAVMAFLNMVITSDLEVKMEEINLLWMLSQCIKLDLRGVESLTEEQLKSIFNEMDSQKWLEVMRMGYTMMSVDRQLKAKEKDLFKFISAIHDMKDQDHRTFYSTMNQMTELTPLDQLVLVFLAHYMVEADGIVRQSELQMLLVLSNMMGVDLDEVERYRIPKDTLYQAVFSMSKHAVIRLVEELLIISIADFKIAEQEYDFIFPILAHFHLDFEEILKQARYRLNEHVEYYELFRAQSEVN
jgi:uncharacterized tellurite resistance protein B-like protein